MQVQGVRREPHMFSGAALSSAGPTHQTKAKAFRPELPLKDQAGPAGASHLAASALMVQGCRSCST